MNTIIKALFLLFCSSLLSQAQNFTYFNKTYGGNDTINILAQAAVPIDSGYMVLGGYEDISHRAFYTQKIDLQGNLQWFRDFETATSGDFTSLSVIEYGAQVLKDGNFLMVVYEKNHNVCFTKLNFAGDTVWSKIYSKIGWQLGKMIVKTPDNGYLIAGMEQNLAADTVKAYSLKVDSLGNFEWDKNYIMGNDARFFTAQYTPWDGGYIFGGMGYSTATGYDMFVVKTNSVGDSLWSRRYGGNEDDCAAFVLNITTHAEYLAGYPIEYLLTSCLYESGIRKLYMAKLDSVGGIIWQHKHQFLLGISGLQILPIIKPDKTFISGGYYRPDFYPQPFIANFYADGTLNWVTTPTLDPEKQCYLKDIRPTEDGGYVLAGFQYSTPQTAWVLKIDSLGNTCSFVGCDSTIYTGYPIGLEEVLLDKVAFSIIPNPTNNYFDVYLSNESIPNQQLSIYDINGRLLQTTAINGQHTLVNVAHLPSGMYYCKLSNDSSVQKLVIIK